MPECIVCQAPITIGAVCATCEAVALDKSRSEIADFYRSLARTAPDAATRAEMLACARKAENMSQTEVDEWDRKFFTS